MSYRTRVMKLIRQQGEGMCHGQQEDILMLASLIYTDLLLNFNVNTPKLLMTPSTKNRRLEKTKTML